jgi:hypothetical protein
MDDPTVRRAAELAEKYRMLAALSAGEPGRTEARRDAMRAIAERFPGAMREWDETSPVELERRRAEAEAIALALSADAPERRADGLRRLAAPQNACLRYGAQLHERLRALLKVKRWLAGRTLSEALAESARRELQVERDELHAIANPDDGRLAERAYREVAGDNGVSVEELKRALFPGKG